MQLNIKKNKQPYQKALCQALGIQRWIQCWYWPEATPGCSSLVWALFFISGESTGQLQAGGQVREGHQWLWKVFWYHLQNGWSTGKEMASKFLGPHPLLCPTRYLEYIKERALWRHRAETRNGQVRKNIDIIVRKLPGEEKRKMWDSFSFV